MATAEGASIPKVAEELGISDQTLRNWIKQKTTGTPLSPTNGKVDDESMKLLGLETENRRLKKEVLQLKKWQAYLTSGVLGKVVLSGADCRHWLSKRIRGTPMKAQHFARNILAVAVLSALGAHAAVAADFSEGVYVNNGEQDVYDNFTVMNGDASDLQSHAGVFIQKEGEKVGSLTVNNQFKVDVSATETHASVLAGVRLDPLGLLKLQDDAVISVKNTAKPSDAEVSAGKVPNATFGLYSNGSTVTAKNLAVGVESYESASTSGVFAVAGTLAAETLTINVKAAQEAEVEDEADGASMGNASDEGLASGAYGLQAITSTVKTGSLNIVLDATNSPNAKGISSTGGSLTTNNLSIMVNAQNESCDDYQALGLEATKAKVSVTEAMNVVVESRNSKYAKGVWLKDGELTAGDVSINVKGQADPGSNYKADGFLAGVSTVTADSLNISVTNTDKASGIVLGDKVMMTVNDLTILAKSDDRVGVGIDKHAVATEKSTLDVTGRTDIRAEGVMARGLALEYAGAEFNGEARIEASGKQSAVGVWAGTRTLVDFKDHAVIKTTARGGEEFEGISQAVFVENTVDSETEATVRFHNGAEIVSDGYAFYGDGNGASANIYLWSHEDTVTNIVGDVYMTNNAQADLDLSKGGTFTGAAWGDGLIYVTLDNGARWNVTEESSVLTLTEQGDGKSALLSFASADATLNVKDRLTIGSGTTVVEMNKLPAAGESYITFVEDNFINKSSGKINAVMSGDFNDAYTGSTSDAVNVAANAILGDDLSNSVTNVYFEEGRLAGAVEASRKDDGSFTVVRKANEKIEAVKTLSVLSALQWRHDMNDLMKRMGELRTSPEGIGGWARVYGSEQAHDGIDMKNASVQVGADADVGMGWKAGAAFSYTDGSSDMTAGSADHKAYGLAAYGTWLGEGGHFVDLIAKVSRLETDYGIKGTSGSFENNAFSLSAEYGRHFELAGGAFVEPQVEVTWGRIMGDDFLNSEGVRIEQDDIDSLIGRMGVRAGFNFPKDKGLVYARASVLHDFKGESDAVASLGAKSVRMSDDIGGTWGEFGVGANFRLTPDTYTYVDLERTTGGEVSEKWRWNVGVRHVF
ncbi:autotransporter outer membrane beta-barrel domain-containing protein [Sutterella sp. KLE1602]|uniref:autotransporter outer membrane beta-barrel domain-containing protein n=1 Tax=Sutterella sp. KLE1602 TaxID=1574262 RepID=UPI0018D354F4|nr:autotransporter outer membrane beta-barrel domain-containing protein [Sutterella sp. KLE1602]